MRHDDRRVKRTQRQLASALIALMAEQRYETLTVREITDAADVGYTTFYRHYADKDALLHEVLNVVLDELVRRLQPGSEASTPATMGQRLFEYVRDHRQMCQVLLGSPAAPRFARQIRALAAATMLRNQTPRENGLVSPELAAQHIVSATLGLVGWWLEEAMPPPPARMGEIYAALIVTPTHQLAFRQPDQA